MSQAFCVAERAVNSTTLDPVWNLDVLCTLRASLTMIGQTGSSVISGYLPITFSSEEERGVAEDDDALRGLPSDLGQKLADRHCLDSPS